MELLSYDTIIIILISTVVSIIVGLIIYFLCNRTSRSLVETIIDERMLKFESMMEGVVNSTARNMRNRELNHNHSQREPVEKLISFDDAPSPIYTGDYRARQIQEMRSFRRSDTRDRQHRLDKQEMGTTVQDFDVVDPIGKDSGNAQENGTNRKYDELKAVTKGIENLLKSPV